VLDVLRGLALAGIFTINQANFSGFIFMPPAEIAALPTAAFDRPVGLFLIWLAYGKFYSLFSLLFGVGFALQLDSAARDGDHRLARFRRRLGVLLAIGLVHLIFIWDGDILALYAMIGFLLVPLRRVSQRALLVTAAVLLLLPVVQQAAIVVSRGALDPGAPLLVAGMRSLEALGFSRDTGPYPLLKEAGLSEVMRFQLTGVWFRYADLLSTGRPYKVLAMFLLGLWAGRSGVLRDLDGWAPVLRRIRRVGLLVGLPASLAQAILLFLGHPPASAWSIVEALAYALGIAPLALAYAAHIALLWRVPIWRDRLSLAIPAGRMALTNYLAQTAIGIGLFYGIGLGWMGEFGPALWPLIAVPVLAAQGGASWWWLARHPFGPMEWLWRAATYGKAAVRSAGYRDSPGTLRP
jgi:uncharacterized protein